MPEDIKPVKATQPVETDEAKPAVASAAPAKKNDKTLKIVLIVVGVLFGLGLLGTILIIVFFSAVFNKATEGVDVNGDGTVTLQSENGKVTTTAGDNAKLTEGFPDDLPIYDPSTLVASTKVSDSQFSAVAKTSASVTDVTSYYKTEMVKQGWTVEYDSSTTDGSLLTFQKGNRTSSVVISNNPDEKSSEKTALVVSVSDQQ